MIVIILVAHKPRRDRIRHVEWRILPEFIFGTVPHLGNHVNRSVGHPWDTGFVVGHMLMRMVALARRLGLSSLGGAIAGVDPTQDGICIGVAVVSPLEAAWRLWQLTLWSPTTHS